MSYDLVSDKEVTFGRPLGKKDMVFVLIYTDEAKPYEDYDYFKNSPDPELQAKANLNIPLVLAQMRWDGKLGFVGGNVEAHHESLLHALRDEIQEEISWSLSIEELASMVEPHATYSKGNRYISSFKMKVTYDEIVALMGQAHCGKHYISENCGNILLQIHENSVDSLLNQRFSGSGNLELAKLIKDENLLEKAQIQKF